MTISYDCEGNGEIHLDVLMAICGDTNGKSMIDLGAGFAPQTRLLGFSEKLYVDKVVRDLDNEMSNFIQCDLLSEWDCGSKVFDVSIMSDVIEHFRKEDGEYILQAMGKCSKKQIIFTPLGGYIIETTPTNNPDSHKSGWYPDDFDGWASVVFKNFHPRLNLGAFFSWHCENIEQDFGRVKNELNNKSWAK